MTVKKKIINMYKREWNRGMEVNLRLSYKDTEKTLKRFGVLPFEQVPKVDLSLISRIPDELGEFYLN